MNAQQFKTLLNRLHACSAAIAWADGKTLKETWETCDRADWLLWLVGKMADKPGWPARKQVVLAACDCAETALKFVPETEDRPRKCLEVVRAWVAGSATIDEVIAARNDAYDAHAAASAAYAHAHAAMARAASVAHASTASVARARAASVAHAAAGSAAYAHLAVGDAAYAAVGDADASVAHAYAVASSVAYAVASSVARAAYAHADAGSAAYAHAVAAADARREARAKALSEMADLVRKALAQFVPAGEGK